MKDFIVARFSICIGLTGNDQSLYSPLTESNDFRAVKYSIPIDYSIAHKIRYEEQGFTPISQPKIVVAYQYFIQYGNNVVIGIIDPGSGKEMMGTSCQEAIPEYYLIKHFGLHNLMNPVCMVWRS